MDKKQIHSKLNELEDLTKSIEENANDSIFIEEILTQFMRENNLKTITIGEEVFSLEV